MPKVSVIVPNYNHERYLRQRLQSILNQTFQDFDLTYLDDASSDDSNAVFAEFDRDPRIKAIYNESNSGSPFRQWNKGVRSTSGEYIWIAESDDVAERDFLANLVSILDNNPHVGLAYSQSRQIDRNNVTIVPSLRSWVEDLSPNRWDSDFIANGTIECQKYLVFRNTIPNASAVLVRRSVYEAIGGAEESLFLTGDWMTWTKILLKSDLAFCAKVLNSFRSHSATVRSRSVLNGTQAYEFLSICQFFAEQNISIPSETLTRIKRGVINNWISLTFDPDNTICCRDRLKFYWLARSNFAQTDLLFFKRAAIYLRDNTIGK